MTEPPHGAETGVPAEPAPPVDPPADPPLHRLDGTLDDRAPASARDGGSVLDPARTPRVRPRHSRRRAALLLVALLVVAGVVVGVLDPFAKPTAPVASKSYSTYTISRQSLSSQTEVTATLGYSGSYTVTVPSGTPPQTIVQDEAAVTSAQAKVTSAKSGTTATAAAAVTSAEQSLAQARTTLQAAKTSLRSAEATLGAAKDKEANDCSGVGSAGAACATDGQGVATDGQAVSSDEQAMVQDEQKLTQAISALSQAKEKEAKAASTAQSNLSAAEQTLATTEAALAAAKEQETTQGGAFSKLPAVGDRVSEGQTLYTVGTTPVVLLYGTTPATRNLYEGESGPDVAELNKDLRALGYTSAPKGDSFTASTASAVDAFQARIGLTETGNLALGQVVFLPTAARITTVTGVLGTDAQPGSTVLTATSTTRTVSIALDANLQSDVKVGDPVTITLPDLRTTPGVVSQVGTVATVPSSSGNNSTTHNTTPTITVDVTPSDPSSIGNLDQAPVTVSITNASVHDALVVPVDALLALAGGGYALEVVPAHGAHYLVPVETGLFDDAQGLVQVTGPQIHIGMRVVVPST